VSSDNQINRKMMDDLKRNLSKTNSNWLMTKQSE
jgi:hypothetical protein